MKKTLLLAGLAVIVTSAAVAATTMAYQGDYTKKGPNYTEERETQMTAAMNNNDYEAWKSLMNGKGVSQKVNKDNFAKFAEAWKLGKDGKTAEADALRKELGLRTSDGTRSGGCSGGCGMAKRGNGTQGAGFVDANSDGVCDNMQK